MASLQARHQRGCARYPWTTFKDAHGCGCEPMYFIAQRHEGKLVREAVGHNRQVAARALDARKGEIAEDEYQLVKDVGFSEWADRWLAAFTGKENTRRAYATTLEPAKRCFGQRPVRKLRGSDVERFLEQLRDDARRRTPKGKPPRELSQATLAKHLRHLKTCLAAAVPQYAKRNPVDELAKTVRPRAEESLPDYFTDGELARLWPELAGRPVYLTLCKLAVATGLRFGELVALTWADVDLLARELHVRRTYVEGIGLTVPKSNRQRVIDLTPQAATLLEEWYTQTGDDGPVFEREEGGHVRNSYALRAVLYPALERAGVSRVGEQGGQRTFHSFRDTFARITLERGTPIVWVKEQLGHSSIQLTVDRYGRWAREASKAQAKDLATVFPF